MRIGCRDAPARDAGATRLAANGDTGMDEIRATDGTRLYAKAWGSGPAIVLVHGWPLNADMWEYQAVPLAKAGFRIITYDRRGFGRSDPSWTGYDYDTAGDDLEYALGWFGV